MSNHSKPNIGELRKRTDIEGLLRALEHDDWHVRRDASSAIGKIAQEEKVAAPLLENVVGPLMKSLKDENAEVRSEAALALSFSFLGAASDPDGKAWAFEGNRTKEVVESLVESLVKDKNETVRRIATLALGAIPIPMKLEEGETIVKRVKGVGGLESRGFLLLTGQRLIYHGYRALEAFSLEIPLTEIVNCDVKKPLFGGKKLVVTARRAIYKNLSNLVLKEVVTQGFSQPPASTIEPKQLEFGDIMEVETLRTEIMEQRDRAFMTPPPPPPP